MSVMIGNSQFTSDLVRLSMDGDSDSGRDDNMVSSLVTRPGLLQYDDPADAVTYENGDNNDDDDDDDDDEDDDDEDDDDEDDDDEDDDDDDDDEDDYEFQNHYVYDISSRLREVNTVHFAEPLPNAKESRVRFADNPVDRVLRYSPTPTLDVNERRQVQREYLMKLFPKDDSEIGDNQSDESDLFSSSDDDDFVDYANKTPSPIVEMPRTPSPSKKNDGLESDEKEGYSSDYETKEENSTDKGEYNTSMDTATRRSQETPTCAALEHNRNIDLELAKKIINLRERSARGPEYQRTSDAPKNLGSQFRSAIQESLKKEPIKESTGADQEVQPAQLTNGKVDSVYEEDRSTSSVETCNLATSITAGGRDTTNVLVNGIEVAKDDNVKVESASRSPEPPADTSNDNKGNMAKQAFVERLLPRDLPIKYPQVAIKLPTSPTPTRSSAANKSLTATPKRSAISYKRDTNVAGRLIAPASGPTAFPPSPTRFVRKNSTPAANGADQQIRPASSIGSNSETTPAHETRKLPAYTGNENSRYGLPAEEKAKLKQERERAKREKEEKARREEEEKRRRKQDAQKTFEAWLRNKNAEIENNKKAAINSTASCRKKTLSPQPPLLNESQNEATANSNTTVTFLTWLKGKNMQEKQRKLQEKLQQIEIEEFKRKHTRQDAQQAYKRWLRKKALESEHRRISQRHRAVEERLSSSPSKSKEVLDRFFESEHFASLNRKQQDNLIQRNSKFTVLNGNA